MSLLKFKRLIIFSLLAISICSFGQHWVVKVGRAVGSKIKPSTVSRAARPAARVPGRPVRPVRQSHPGGLVQDVGMGVVERTVFPRCRSCNGRKVIWTYYGYVDCPNCR